MSSGAAAVVAAAAARRRMLREEEQMTTYGSDDLAHDWEFKIVRANTAAFRSPARLNRLLQEEARAGWIMLEKFDDSRIRFKRPRQARINDSKLPPGVDPYRVYYGMSPGTFTGLLVIAILGLSFVILGLTYLFLRAFI